MQGPFELDYKGLSWQAGLGSRVSSKEAHYRGNWMAMGQDGEMGTDTALAAD